MSLPDSLISALRGIFGGALVVDPAECLAYGYDNSRRQAQPDAVVFPIEHAQVVQLVRACRATRTPLIARGRGTNTTGATVPIGGGVVVSFERMNHIVRIDTDNRLAVVEPGVLNGDLQAALAERGFFWPPDPTSSPYCTIGGNLACNAAGPRAVKYGSCRENTLALRAVNESGLAGSRLRGPTGIVVGKDAVAAAKVLTDFAKENEQKPEVKGGLLDGRAIQAAQVQKLASLPSREQLLAELGAGLMSPMASFVGAMNGLLYMFAGALDALKTQREGA